MLRRSLIVVAAFLAALAVVPLAAAALVHIRVEGKTLTIFGATNPTIVATTPLDALQAAAKSGEFYEHVTASSFGNYVDQIGFYPGSGDAGWFFKVNGVSPPVGADQVQLKDGDFVEWYYATFGPNGGPPTLTLSKTASTATLERRFCSSREMPSFSNVLRSSGSTSSSEVSVFFFFGAE